MCPVASCKDLKLYSACNGLTCTLLVTCYPEWSEVDNLEGTEFVNTPNWYFIYSILISHSLLSTYDSLFGLKQNKNVIMSYNCWSENSIDNTQ